MATVTPIQHSHIRLDERGMAYIDNLRFKVIHLVREYLGGYTPKKMLEAHHDVLSMAQIFAALAYYHDHQDAFDAQIKREDEEEERDRREWEKSPQTQAMLAKLRERRQSL